MGLAFGVHASEGVAWRFDTDAGDVRIMAADAEGFSVVALEGGVYRGVNVGAPDLPVRMVNLRLPAGARAVGVSARADWRRIAVGVMPSVVQPVVARSRSAAAPVGPDPRSYAGQELYPGAVVELTGNHQMGGHAWASLALGCVRWDPVLREVWLAERVYVVVNVEQDAAPLTGGVDLGAMVDRLVVNPASGGVVAVSGGDVEYLIVTSDGLVPAFEELARHRSQSMTTAVIGVTQINAAYGGVDLQARIRACIQEYVADHGTRYVVLGGDDTVVPDRDCVVRVSAGLGSYYDEAQMPTDLYYSGLDGSWDGNGNGVYGEADDAVDLGWDVIVGRIPVRTVPEAIGYIEKLRRYEALPGSHWERMLMGGTEAWSSYSGWLRPSDDVETSDGHAAFRSAAHVEVSDSEMWSRRLYRDGVHATEPVGTLGLYFDSLSSWDGVLGSGDSVLDAVGWGARWDAGWHDSCFSGHGSPEGWGLESGQFGVTDAQSVTGLVVVSYTDSCMTAHFDKESNSIDGVGYVTEPCLAEALLRNPDGGALVYIGCSRYGWGRADTGFASNTSRGGPSVEYAYKFYERMRDRSVNTVGEAFALHKADMAGQSIGDSAERWLQLGINLLGDPAVPLWSIPWGDSDGDGISDGWEERYFGTRDVALAPVDTDLDGHSNLEEYRAGTDPTNASSVLSVSIEATGRGMAVSWPTAAEREYRLFGGTEIASEDLLVVTTGESGSVTVFLDAGSLSNRFYRVEAEMITP